jgi:hypothetical protein
MSKEISKSREVARRPAGGDGHGRGSRRNIDLKGVDLHRPSIESKRVAVAEEELRRLKERGAISAGAVERVIDLAFNPSRDKLREVTIIDRMQGRTFPLIDTMNGLFLECVKIAAYRESPGTYEATFEESHPPIVFDVMGEYLMRTAQWQKSIAGKNLERATDIALAETEKGTEEEDQYAGSGRGYED